MLLYKSEQWTSTQKMLPTSNFMVFKEWWILLCCRNGMASLARQCLLQLCHYQARLFGAAFSASPTFISEHPGGRGHFTQILLVWCNADGNLFLKLSWPEIIFFFSGDRGGWIFNVAADDAASAHGVVGTFVSRRFFYHPLFTMWVSVFCLVNCSWPHRCKRKLCAVCTFLWSHFRISVLSVGLVRLYSVLKSVFFNLLEIETMFLPLIQVFHCE